jgi:hypothetical protein
MLFLSIFTLLITETTGLSSNYDNLESSEKGMVGTKTRANDNWIAQGLWTDKEEINDIAIGDVDSSHPGDEIVVGGNADKGRKGKVLVIYGFGSSWVKERIFLDDWQVYGVAIGDVYPKHPGNEIVVVGWSNKVTLIYKSLDSNEWITKRLYHDTDWIYDVDIGDLDPTNPGNEIAVVGDPKHVLILYYSNETDSWENRLIEKDVKGGNVSGGFTIVSIGNFDSNHPGEEMIISGPTSSVTEPNDVLEGYYNTSSSRWEIVEIGEVENQPIEMVIGDFYSKHPGNECALVSIKRSVLMIYQDIGNNEWVMENIWTDSESIQDVALFDIIPDNEKDELVAVGYSNSATILMENTQEQSGWENRNIYSGDLNLNGVAVGNFDTFHHGPEIAILKSGGNVIKVQSEQNRFNLFMPEAQFSVPAGFEVTVPLITSIEGGYSNKVLLSVSNNEVLEQEGLNFEFDNYEILPPELAQLRVIASVNTPKKDYEIEIKGTSYGLIRSGDFKGTKDTKGSENMEVSINFTLSVLQGTEPAFNITISPRSSSVIADFSTSFVTSINTINNWEEDISLDLTYPPPGTKFSFGEDIVIPPSSTTLTISTTSSTGVGRYFSLVNGRSVKDPSIKYATVLVLDVAPPSPDFYLLPEHSEVNLSINSSNEVIVQSYSIFGFDEEISITLDGLPKSISYSIKPNSLIPPGNFIIDSSR